MTYQVPTHENDDQYVGKIDYQISEKHSLFFRILESKVVVPGPVSGCSFNFQTEILGGSCLSNNMLNSTAAGENQLASSAAIGDTYVISPSMVNAARLSFNRTAATLQSAHLFTFVMQALVTVRRVPAGSGAAARLVNWAARPSAACSSLAPASAMAITGTVTAAFNDDVSWLKGAHQMTFGFGWLHGGWSRTITYADRRELLFTGAVTGSGMTDFLLGDMSAVLQGLPNAYSAQQNIVGLYFTDT